MLEERYRAAVASAMPYMDKVYGRNWPTRIDVSILDLRHPTNCILGQLGSYNAGMRKLAREGFEYVPGIFASNSFRPLWIEAIQERMAEIQQTESWLTMCAKASARSKPQPLSF